MAGQVSQYRRQLKSVKATQKITNAMALVATAKLQRQRYRMIQNNEYAETFQRIVLSALAGLKGNYSSPYLTGHDVNNPLHIIITSNSGLCGGYNAEVLKYVQETVPDDEAIFVIGTQGTKWLRSNNYMVVKAIDELDDLRPSVINRLIDNIITLFKSGEFSMVDIIYTEYVNTLVYSPVTYQLLPIDIPAGLPEKDVEFAPDVDTAIDSLIRQYISAVIYSTFLEAKTSENASRRAAMDNANNNAEELVSSISLHLNQARQAAITQEVNEITAGADAL